MSSPTSHSRHVPALDFSRFRSTPLTPLKRFTPRAVVTELGRKVDMLAKKDRPDESVVRTNRDLAVGNPSGGLDTELSGEEKDQESRKEEDGLQAEDEPIADLGNDPFCCDMIEDGLFTGSRSPDRPNVPSPTAYRSSAPTVESDEDDWRPNQRVARTPKTPRRIILSDEASDLDSTSDRPQRRDSSSIDPRSANLSKLAGRPFIDLTGSDKDEGEDEEEAVRVSRNSLADELFGQESPEKDEGEVDEEEAEREWMKKYYDDSLGSLRDFIVDDEEDEDGYKEAASGSNEGNRITRRRDADSERMAKSDSESDAVLTDPDDSRYEDDEDDASAILRFSPAPRPLVLPDLGSLSLHDCPCSPSSSTSSLPPSDSPATNHPKGCQGKSAGSKTSKPNRREWKTERVRIANEIFAELDRRVFEARLGPNGAGAGARIEWSNRLLTTAGTASEAKVKQADGTIKREVKITLSMKVCTGRKQILNTVAHEMCHLASWEISNERKNPHGRVFKTWGRKVMRARPDLQVTTKHDYEIEYKYQWKCASEGCGKIYQRHSKSYLKQYMTLAKAALPGASHGDVMRALSRQWTNGGPAGDHQAFWRTIAAAAAS